MKDGAEESLWKSTYAYSINLSLSLFDETQSDLMLLTLLPFVLHAFLFFSFLFFSILYFTSDASLHVESRGVGEEGFGRV